MSYYSVNECYKNYYYSNIEKQSIFNFLNFQLLSSFNIGANGWYMLSGRISESVPVRRTRNCDARIRSWRTTEPRPAICTA